MLIGIFQDDFAQRVREVISKRETYLGTGKVSSLEDYRTKCGEIAGLKEALELFKDVAKRHGEIDEGE